MVKKLFRQYLSTLKPLPIEGIPDLIFFRPIAFILVKILYYFPVSPNQVSVSAMLTGIGAGICFSKGTPKGFITAGVLYLVAIILDCTDGMLARLKKKGTPAGRIIDGIVDYINGIAIFTGLGIGLTKMSVDYPIPVWLVVVIAAVSMVSHSTLVDYYRQQFYIHALGIRKPFREETAEFSSELARLRQAKRQYLKQLTIRLYLYYCWFQQRYSRREHHFDARHYYHTNVYLLRLWLMIEQSVHVIILAISGFMFKPEIFLVYTIVLANSWVLIMVPVQRIVNHKIELHNPSS